MVIKEDKSYYASIFQRDLLKKLNEYNQINELFFLTGGTALSVFYLHHRKSDDLDLFSTENINLSEIDFWIQRKFDIISKINDTDFIKSYLINNVKVEFVIDHLSIKDKKQLFNIDENINIKIDTIRNISSNKLCTVVSRSEVKDYIDLFFLNENGYIQNFNELYTDAMNKDKIFEDAPTASFKIEEGYEYVKNNYDILPPGLKDFDKSRFEYFFEFLIKSIYNRIN